MQLSIEYKVPQIPLFIPAEGRKVIGELIRNTIHLALQDIAGHVSEEAGAFADTGHLAQSFGADPFTVSGGIDMTGAENLSADEVVGRVFSSLPYAIVMEEGRRPGAPISRVGIDAIGLWAQRKLHLSSHDADHVKWAIATVIIRRGLPARHFAQRGFERSKPRIEQMFQILSQQIVAGLAGQGAGGLGRTGSV